MNFNNKRILVTGGNGYIGSHTSIKLLEAGYQIVILDNLSNSLLNVKEKITEISKKEFVFVEGDIRDRKILKRIFAQYSIGAVIHFAGLKAVEESEIDPLNYYDNNVNGSLILLQEMFSWLIQVLL